MISTLLQYANYGSFVGAIQSDTLMQAILIGTVVWLVLGLIIGYKTIKHIGKVSKSEYAWQNQKIGLVALIMGGIQMWMMWVCCYMHQTYPLIEPKIEF